MKPDNVLANWAYDAEGEKIVSDVALGDFDLVFKSKNGASCYTPYAIGNAMWRSPEGQTGRAVTKASDIYSFGLVVRYLEAKTRNLLTPAIREYTLWEEATSYSWTAIKS